MKNSDYQKKLWILTYVTYMESKTSTSPYFCEQEANEAVKAFNNRFIETPEEEKPNEEIKFKIYDEPPAKWNWFGRIKKAYRDRNENY